jgi:hypothetical protein
MCQGLEGCGNNGQLETPIGLMCGPVELRNENKNMVFHSLLLYVDTCLSPEFALPSQL